MKKQTFLAVLGALLWLPTLASAVEIAAGTAENITIRQCVAGGSPAAGTWSSCYYLNDPIAWAYGGAPGALTSAASAGTAVASASGSVSLDPLAAGAPVLHASASTVAAAPGQAEWRANTNSVALQRYTYTGAAPTSRTFGGTLTYAQSGTAAFPNGVGGGIYAAVDVFTLPAATVDAGTTAESNFSTLFRIAGQAGYHSLASDEFFDAAPTAAGSHALGATVLLAPGDEIWIWALVQTPAVNGGVIDASHTFVTQWDDSTGLLPAAVVPEPGTWWLMVIGLAALPVLRRRPALAAASA